MSIVQTYIFGKNTGQYHPANATNTMTRKHVQRIIQIRFVLSSYSQVADNGRYKPYKQSLGNSYVTGRRCNSHQTNYSPNTSAQGGNFFTSHSIKKYPCYHG